jgi:hypothetical protein
MLACVDVGFNTTGEVLVKEGARVSVGTDKVALGRGVLVGDCVLMAGSFVLVILSVDEVALGTGVTLPAPGNNATIQTDAQHANNNRPPHPRPALPLRLLPSLRVQPTHIPPGKRFRQPILQPIRFLPFGSLGLLDRYERIERANVCASRSPRRSRRRVGCTRC